MKKPVVDYRQLRLRNINSPQFRHLHLLWGWVGYLFAFYLTEKRIPPEQCHVIHHWLDDRIPFCEYFAIFYIGWYLLIIGSLIYFLLYHIEMFRKLQTYFLVTQIIAVVVFIVYPSKQLLRPIAFPRDNLFTKSMHFLYSIDTNTGVLPSLHVAFSLGIASAWLRYEKAAAWLKGTICAFCLGVCFSVSFVKQHSVLDILAALPVCAVAEWFAFYRRKPPAGRLQR